MKRIFKQLILIAIFFMGFLGCSDYKKVAEDKKINIMSAFSQAVTGSDYKAVEQYMTEEVFNTLNRYRQEYKEEKIEWESEEKAQKDSKDGKELYF